MNAELVRGIIEGAGGSITAFADESQVFGSWYALLELNKHTLRLLFDGRESCIELQQTASGHPGWTNIQSEPVNDSSETSVLRLCKAMLLEQSLAAT